MTINETQKLKPNPKTQKDHKRETFWQITFPLILGVVFILILAILTFMAATGDGPITQAADAALIFLIIPLMLFTLISTIIFAALTFGIIKLNSVLPLYSKQAHDALIRVRQQVQLGSDKAVAPILKIHGYFASLKALKRK
jgi:heme/copper-type cytochrome/quinol oxidase subunit 2